MSIAVVDTLYCPNMPAFSELIFKIFLPDSGIIRAMIILPNSLKIYCFNIDDDKINMFAPLSMATHLPHNFESECIKYVAYSETSCILRVLNLESTLVIMKPSIMKLIMLAGTL